MGNKSTSVEFRREDVPLLHVAVNDHHELGLGVSGRFGRPMRFIIKLDREEATKLNDFISYWLEHHAEDHYFQRDR